MANHWRFFVATYTLEFPGKPNQTGRSLFAVATVYDKQGKPHYGDRLYYGTSHQWTVVAHLQDFAIEKDYGVIDREYGEKEDEVMAKYLHDYPPEATDITLLDPAKEAVDVDGWLNRKGVFWRCGYMGHSDLAFDLCRAFYPRQIDDEQTLFKHGWLCVAHGGMRYGWDTYPQKPSTKQIAWLRMLRGMNEGFEHYTGGIDRFLRVADIRYRKATP